MMSVFSRLGAAILLQRKAILITVVLAAAIYFVVQTNHAHAQRVLAALSSPSQSVRDQEVLGLLQSGKLVDALDSTEDPNQDATSPQNVRSIQIRQNATDSVDRLIAAHKVADQTAMDALFLLRKDADSGVQAKATAGLVTLGTSHPSNLSKIAARLQDGDPDIRSAASDTLGQIGGDKTAKLIDPLLKDPTAQDAVQSAMEKIGAPSVPYLIAHLSDPDLVFRQRVVTMLGQIASPQAIVPLENVAVSNVPSMRLPALVALSDTVLTNYDTYQKAQSAVRTLSVDPKTPAADLQTARQAELTAAAAFAQTRPAEPPLIATLRSSTDDSEARIQAALALGRLDSPADVATLVGALGDYDSRVRQAALSGVQSAGAPAADLLTAALDQGPPVARAAAAEALGVIGTPTALAALQSKLADNTTPVDLRRSALMGLGQNGSPSVIPLLVTALGDPDGSVTATASDALLNPGIEQAAIPSLITTFSQQSPRPFNASQTLARMGDLPTEALKTAAASLEPQTQTWAAVTLGQSYSSDPTVAAALQPLTHSPNAEVQYAATQALTHLSGA